MRQAAAVRLPASLDSWQARWITSAEIPIPVSQGFAHSTFNRVIYTNCLKSSSGLSKRRPGLGGLAPQLGFGEKSAGKAVHEFTIFLPRECQSQKGPCLQLTLNK